MRRNKNLISVFEHRKLLYGKDYDGASFKESHFNALVKLNELHNNQYFTVIHKGIKFSNYVGVIQVEGLTIQILPKIDNTVESDELWQSVLVEMLRTTKKLKVNNVGHANVAKQKIHLLDLYFEWFLNEVQQLQRKGLIKKYYKRTANTKSLKGKLEFAGHLQQNLVHKERFYTTHQVYGKNHLEHQIIFLALLIIERFTKGSHLYSYCKTITVDFPEVDPLKIHTSLFDGIVYTRKNTVYKTALEIARFIILNVAPNINAGNENMLALLFDMNSLWEEYILAKLKAVKSPNIEVIGQSSKPFWSSVSIRPDIIVKIQDETFVIDTKWKNIYGKSPSIDDLRQMYAYNRLWDSKKAILLYPSIKTIPPDFKSFKDGEKRECGLGQLNILEGNRLKKDCGVDIMSWLTGSSN